MLYFDIRCKKHETKTERRKSIHIAYVSSLSRGSFYVKVVVLMLSI